MFNGIIWIDREDYIIFIHCSSQNSFFITPHRSLNPSHPSPPSACSTRCASSPRRSSRPPQQCRWPGSSDRCCVPSCGTTRGGGTGGTTRVSWGRKIMGRENPEKNNWKHVETSPVCHGDASMLKMQSNSSNANLWLPVKVWESAARPEVLKQWLSTHHHWPIPFWVPSTSFHRSSRCFPATASCPGVDSSAHRCCKCFPCNLDRLKKRRTDHDRVYTTQTYIKIHQVLLIHIDTVPIFILFSILYDIL